MEQKNSDFKWTCAMWTCDYLFRLSVESFFELEVSEGCGCYKYPIYI